MRLTIKQIVKAGGALVVAALLASASAGQEEREIARNSFPSVVLIVVNDPKTHRASLGSGFFVQDDLIVTNYHVIKGYSRVSVNLVGHKETYRAQVVTANTTKDLAILRVIGVQATPLSLGDVSEVAIGDAVFVIGNPEGLEATLSEGIVSGVRQFGGNRYFQISAPISHGSSGGPVLNKSGEVIGIAMGALKSGQNLNFAIPISEVVAVMDALMGNRYPYLVPKQPSNPYDAIVSASSGGPARKTDPLTEAVRTLKQRKSQPTGYVKDAINEAVEGVRKQPNSAEAHFVLAETYRLYNHYEGAIENAIVEYKRVILMNPQQAKAYFGLADCYNSVARDAEYDSPTRRSNAESAMTQFKQAIRLEPDFADAHAGIGDSYVVLRRYDEALSAFQLAIRLDPKKAKRYRDLAHAYTLADRYDEAIAAYKTAADLSNRPQDYLDIGEIYELTRSDEAAIANYKQVIEMTHNRSFSFLDTLSEETACARLLDCFVRLNKLAEGIEYFRDQAVMLAHDNTKTWDGKANYPATAWSHFALGILYLHSSDPKAALEQYKILKAQGKGRPAKLAEDLLNQIYK